MSESMNPIQKCPCCGNEVKKATKYESGFNYACLVCPQCPVRTNWVVDGTEYKDFAKLIKSWNRRTPEPMTGVVRWHRAGEYKPEPGRQFIKAPRSVYRGGKLFCWVPADGHLDNMFADDDLWAYLPDPPEEMQ